jgi:hypothetical protein
MKPAPMTDEQIDALVPDYWDEWSVHAKALIASRDAQWEQMLASQPQQWVEGKVYPIDNAEPPPPETGFQLGEFQ